MVQTQELGLLFVSSVEDLNDLPAMNELVVHYC